MTYHLKLRQITISRFIDVDDESLCSYPFCQDKAHTLITCKFQDKAAEPDRKPFCKAHFVSALKLLIHEIETESPF